MMRTVLIGCLLLSAAACFAQGAVAPSVVTGQNPDGSSTVVTIIPLKYLDPTDAANLLMALGYPGTVIPVNPVHGPGEGIGSYANGGSGYGQGNQGGRRSHGPNYSSAGRNNNNNGSNYGQGYNNNGYNGYSGYQNGNQSSGQYPGYQSPYSTR